MEFEKVLKKRRSVRKYLDKKVPEEAVRQILNLANLAPSAGNLQAFKVAIVRKKEIKERLSQAAWGQRSIQEAPVVLVACADREQSAWKYGARGRTLYALQDATIFAAYAQLAAASLGISSVWVGAFDEEAIKKLLGLPKEFQPIAIVPLGFAAEITTKTERKSLNEIIYRD